MGGLRRVCLALTFASHILSATSGQWLSYRLYMVEKKFSSSLSITSSTLFTTRFLEIFGLNTPFSPFSLVSIFAKKRIFQADQFFFYFFFLFFFFENVLKLCLHRDDKQEAGVYTT